MSKSPLLSKKTSSTPRTPNDAKTSSARRTDLLAVMERRTQRLEPPPRYQVVLLNDDYTPMEFVVVLIQEVFHKDQATATKIMLKIHTEGRASCGVYVKDIALSKVDQVLQVARAAAHPLQCVCEPVPLEGGDL